MDVDLVTVVNLLLCLVIVTIGLLGHRRSRHALPLVLAVIFPLFGLSHALVLSGLSDGLEMAVFTLGMLAYGLVIYILYRYVRVLDIFCNFGRFDLPGRMFNEGATEYFIG